MTDRRGTRNSPKASIVNSLVKRPSYNGRDGDVEGETVTSVEARINSLAMVRLSCVSRGLKLWYASKETTMNLGDLSASSQGVECLN